MVEKNRAKVIFDAISVNEGFARMVVMGFMMDMNPTMDELQDVKTAVSEAVTNAIVHGYAGTKGIVEMKCRIKDNDIEIDIIDKGCGIKDVPLAMQPLYSSSEDDERSGMGFTVMQSFMDTVKVVSELGVGTTVSMTKKVGVLLDD